MNRLTVVIASVVLAALVGIPPVIGSFTEQRIMAQAERLETMTDSAYSVEILEYEGGWFGSTAKLRASLGADYVQQITAAVANQSDDPATALTAMMLQSFLSQSMPLVAEIGHGPVMFSDGLRVGVLSSVLRLDPETEGLAEILETLNIPYLFEVRTLLGVTGSADFIGEIPAIDVEDDPAQISFSGFMIEGSYDFANRHIESEGGIEFLRATAPGLGSASVEDILLAADVTGLSPILWLGDLVTEVGLIRIDSVGPDGPLDIELTNAGVNFTTATDTSGELVSIEGSYYIGSLLGINGLDLADARIDLTLSDFSREALEAYYEYSRLVAVSPESAPPLFPGVQDLLYLTLSTAPTIEIGPVALLWNGQPFEANIRLDVDASGLPERDAFNMFSRQVLFAAISIDGHLDMSEEIARTIAAETVKYQLRSGAARAGNELPESDLEALAQSQALGMLLGLVAQGLIEESEAGYRSELSFVNGELTVNGTVLPIGLPL
jgi:hypothetical protein